MGTCREQIEHLEHCWEKENKETPWKKFSYSRKWLKKQMNRFIRRTNKKIEDDEVSVKGTKRKYFGWEW